MQKQLIIRVIRERYVDTRKYRYRLQEREEGWEQWAEIERIPLEDLGTPCDWLLWDKVWDSRSLDR